MSKQNMWTTALGAVLTLALLLGIAISPFNLGPSTAIAQDEEPEMSSLPRTITVVGEGSVSIDPDVAQTTIGVEVVKTTIIEATAEAREVMEAVLNALMEAGVAESDIQTSGFSIWAERSYDGPPRPVESAVNSEEPVETVRYRVSNQVMVTIRDLESVGAILDAAIEAGANNIFGVNFRLDDPSVVESDARAKAVENAKAKAEELAALTGAEVGEVITISEVIGQGGGYFGGNFASSARQEMGGGGAGPISPGQLNLSMQIQVTFAMR